uniref:CSON014425 protein n=1 Tax=Culicoides sonorensis TaxID=179676 RepID=A0A336LHY0_CULSO
MSESDNSFSNFESVITTAPQPQFQNEIEQANGLDALKSLNHLLVEQNVEKLETLTGFETNNKYTIKTLQDKTIFFAVEENDCFTRNCFGHVRPFEMRIFDNNGDRKNEVIHLSRPLRCSECCFPGFLQKLEVRSPSPSPSRELFGTVEQIWSISHITFNINDASGDPVLKIQRPYFFMECCSDVDFEVKSMKNEPMGKVTKQWSGIAQESLTKADNFEIKFPMDLDVKIKAVLLGACFLIVTAPQPQNEIELSNVTQTQDANGLEALQSLDHLLVKQKVELLEAFTGFETNNKYAIMNIQNQAIFFAAEDNDCCTRNCFGSVRPFEMQIFNQEQKEIIHLSRPLRCAGCGFPCCLQKLQVCSPSGELFGTVQEDWSFFSIEFSIKNASGETVLKIQRSGCFLECCSDVKFDVKSLDGVIVGHVTKQWSGLAKELLTNADNFGIQFPKELDVKIKAVLLGACFLIDFMYFEQNDL